MIFVGTTILFPVPSTHFALAKCQYFICTFPRFYSKNVFFFFSTITIYFKHAEDLSKPSNLICSHEIMHTIRNLSPFFFPSSSFTSLEIKTRDRHHLREINLIFFFIFENRHFRRHSTFLPFHSVKWSRHDVMPPTRPSTMGIVVVFVVFDTINCN